MTTSSRQIIDQFIPTISRFFTVKIDLNQITTHTDLALAKRNITSTRPRSDGKYIDLTIVSRRIFDLPPSIKYLKNIYTKSADTRLADKFYYD